MIILIITSQTAGLISVAVACLLVATMILVMMKMSDDSKDRTKAYKKMDDDFERERESDENSSII
jgi:ABC-type transport system involved in cytochrome bd biosynthesis fused ATPase/permease subunit